MALTRRSPRVFEYRDPFSFWAFDWPELFRSAPSLPVEEYLDGDTLVIRAELPGIAPDKDVEITIGDGLLHIHAERRQEEKVEAKDLFRSELRYGAFTRALPLPAGTGEKDVDASYKDGILEIRVPVEQQKVEAAKIPIRTS